MCKGYNTVFVWKEGSRLSSVGTTQDLQRTVRKNLYGSQLLPVPALAVTLTKIVLQAFRYSWKLAMASKLARLNYVAGVL